MKAYKKGNAMTSFEFRRRKRRRTVLGILAVLPFAMMGRPADPAAVGAPTAHGAVTPL
jgi:hypothetical protein